MNLVMLLVGLILDLTTGGLMLAKIASTSYHNLPDLISISSHNNSHTRTPLYDNQSTSQINWFDLVGAFFALCQPEPLYAFDSIDAILMDSFQEAPLETEFWEQSDNPSRWNLYWSEAATYGGGLDVDNPVCGQYRTEYDGVHLGWFTICDPKRTCDFERQNWVGADSTIGHAPAATTTAKAALIPFIVIEPPTPTPSEIDVYNWHWRMCLTHCDVRIRTR